MNVRMPDGTIIQNVPDGTTQTELSRRLGLFQQQTAPAELGDDDSALQTSGFDIPGIEIPGLNEIGASVGKFIAETIRPTKELEIERVSVDLGSRVRDANTVGQKIAIVKKQFPKAKLAQNESGDFGFKLSKDFTPVSGFGKEKTVKAGAFVSFDKPALTVGDLKDPARFIERNLLTIGTSAAAAPLGVAKTVLGKSLGHAAAVVGVGAAGAVDAILQGDFENIASNAIAAASGEGVGRGIVVGAPIVAKAFNAVFRKLSGKAPEAGKQAIDSVVTPDGIITPEAIAELRKHGISKQDMTDLVEGEIKRRVNRARPEDKKQFNTFGEKLFRDVTVETKVDRAIKETKEDFLDLNQFSKRKKVAKKGGLTGDAKPTIGQSSGRFADQQAETELTKDAARTGEEIRARFAQQDAALVKQGEKIKQVTGGVDDEIVAGSSVATATRLKKEKVTSEVKKLYQIAEKENAGKAVQPATLIKVLKENLTKQNSVKEIRDVIAQLKTQGIITPKGRVRAKSVNELEETRQFFNELISADKRSNRIMFKFINALDDDVTAIAGPEFKAARAKAAEKFNEFEPDLKIFRSRGIPKSDVVKKIVSGEIPESQLFKKVVVGGPREALDTLKTTLADTREGKKAWSNMQAMTARWLWDKSTNQAAKNELGDVVFNAGVFKNALKSLETSGKLRVLFDQSTITKLNNIRDAALLRVPQRGASNTSNTASALLNLVRNKLSQIPVLKDLARPIELFLVKNRALKDPVKEIVKPVVTKVKGAKQTKRRALISPLTSSASAESARQQRIRETKLK